MLSDALKEIIKEQENKACSAGKWISQQDPEVQRLFEEINDNPDISYTKVYKVIASEGALPFKRTTFISHMARTCICSSNW